MWELVTRKLPYSEYEVSQSRFMAKFEDAIIGGLRPTIPENCNPVFAKMISDCWQEDPDKRPSMEDIYQGLLYLRRPQLQSSSNTISNNKDNNKVPLNPYIPV